MRSSWNSSRLLSLLPSFNPISCLRRVWLCWECVPDPECGAGTCTSHTLKSKEGELNIAPATGLSQAGNYDRVAWTTGSCISLFFKYFLKFISERRERNINDRRESLICCLLQAPYLEWSLQSSHIPLTGIKPGPLQPPGGQAMHSAKLAKASYTSLNS